MKIKLYEPFKRWAEKGCIWIFSDTHFADSDCLLMNENWITPEEQVKVLTSFISKNDTFICLGDVGDISYVKQIKGYKVLLTGNHDKGVSNYKKKFILQSVIEDEITGKKETVNLKEFDSYQDAQCYLQSLYAKDFQGQYRIVDDRLFDEVYSGPLFINDEILLSHEPVELGFGINIHGHVHNGKHEYIDPDGDYAMVNVAADVVNYKPLRLDKIIEKYHTKDLHRITVDLATERSILKNQ